MFKRLEYLNSVLIKTFLTFIKVLNGGFRKYWGIVLFVFLIILLGLIIDGIYLNSIGRRWANWTGFGEYIGGLPKDDRPKTLWDLLQLLIIPLVLSGGALLFNATQKKIEQISTDNKQKEDLLQAYFKEIGLLMTEKDLFTKKDEPNSPVRMYAQVLTTTALRSLDTRRQDLLFQFLRDCELGNFLLISASLEASDLHKAGIYRLNLSQIDLSRAYLYEADLGGSFLGNADFGEANLMNAELIEADLSEAWMRGANLTGANFSRANLTGADLSGADLTRATLNDKQLQSVKSLTGAIMPDGTKHE